MMRKAVHLCCRYHQRGAVSVIALFLLIGIVILTVLFTLRQSNTGITDSMGQSADVAALFLAESGLEYATQQLSSGIANCGTMAVTTQTFGRGSYTIDTTLTTDYDGVTGLAASQCRIQVTGTVPEMGTNVRRTIQSIVSTSGASGAIAFDNIETRTRNNSSSANWNHLVTGTNPVLILAVSLFGTSSTVTTATYNGSNLSPIAARNNAGGTGLRVEMWYLKAPAIGNHSVNINLSGGSTRFVVSSISYTGVDQVNPIESSQTGAQFSTAPTPSPQVTTVTNNAWVVDAMVQQRDTPTPTAGAGQTQLWSNTTGGSPALRITGAGSYKGPVSPVGTATMSWSLSTARNWAIVAAAIKPAAAGSSGVLSWRELSQ